MNRWLWLVARSLASVALLAWLANQVDLGRVAADLAKAGPRIVFAVLALQLVNTALKSYKWQRLLAADGIHIGHRDAFASYLVGTFFNLFLPSSVGGDAVRAVELARRSGRTVATVTSVAADRVLGFAAISIVGLAALAFGAAAPLGTHERFAAVILYLGVGVASFLAFTGWPAWFLRVAGLARSPRLVRLVTSIGDSLAAYRRAGLLPSLLFLSVAAQVIVVVAIWMIARSVDVQIPLAYFFVAVPLVGLVESLPFTIYGIGLRDVSYVYVLGLAGATNEQALAISVLYFVLSVAYSLLGGVVFTLRGTPSVATPQ